MNTLSGSDYPIHRVTPTGETVYLGYFDASQNRLHLHEKGYPFLDVGIHTVDGDLPWVFEEMAPAGFLAERFICAYPDLGLPRNRYLWQAKHVLKAISHRGEDLAGNLIVGADSLERYQQQENAIAQEVSYVGGVQPKIANPTQIIKYIPKQNDVCAQRWADLLRTEAHCAAILRKNGIAAAQSVYTERDGRGYLEIERFDRIWHPSTQRLGRVGMVSLYHLGAALYGEIESAPAVMEQLQQDGLIASADIATQRMLHLFAAYIGNTDAHLGNYSLLIDADGRARLAPSYDVLPMALSPRHDELPDTYLKPHPPAPALLAGVSHTEQQSVLQWVQDLWIALEQDMQISPSFRDLWRQYVRALLPSFA